MPSNTRGPRVRAPELRGRAWLNTGGRDLRLADLRGRVVVVDFWTFCCVNCLHVLDELRPLEDRWADVLVAVGVHSPKFAHEADAAALAAAVERYDVPHPVLDDPDLVTWRQYAVRAWPTLAVIDPEGYVVAQMSGEGHGHVLERIVAGLVAEHEAKGTLRRGDAPYVPPPPAPTVLRFPGKALALPGGGFLVSDSGHHSLAVLDGDGETLLRRIGHGDRGLRDGGPGEARFSEPQGMAALPTDIAAAVGYDVVVADTVNHALRGVRPATGEVLTVAGIGRQWWQGERSSGPAREVALSSPWDVAWQAGRMVVAMAGAHQLWAFDPVADTVEPIAGTTNEGVVDGEAASAWFAQPSGLAVDGDTLWLADAESSALRRLESGVVHTEVGRGLFEFGHVDGPADEALLQHPLGVVALPDGSVAVADTYNGAVRRFDLRTGEVSTLATGLAEPSDVLVDGSALVVVESAAHRLARVLLPDDATYVLGDGYRTRRPATEVATGQVEVEVVFQPPDGQKLDDRFGPATHLVVSTCPPDVLVDGAGAGPALRRRLVFSGDPAEGMLHVAARAASCDVDAEHPACHIHQQDWGIPVSVTDGGASRLSLVLQGPHPGVCQ